MAEEDTIFQDGENLQSSIAKALQEGKALLCFVADDGEESTRWQEALLDTRIRDNLLSSTVALRLKAGSEQARFLNAVCPVQVIPAVVIIYNAQVVANFQNGQTSFEQFRQQLEARYSQSDKTTSDAAETTKKVMSGYLDLPSSESRMRLPNNAYDHLRTLTQRYVASGVSGRALLEIQLRLLESLEDDSISSAVKTIREQSVSKSDPALPDEVANKLLNLPASRVRGPSNTAGNSVASSATDSSTGGHVPSRSQGSSQSQQPQAAVQPPPASSFPSPSQGIGRPGTTASQTVPARSESSNPSAAQSQRAEYVEAQKKAEAERARIKAQIEADKKARREADRKVREEAEILRRRAELSELRKANSTTTDPKASDIRIQVRTFDGSTIRTTFPAEASVANNVRPWIDSELAKKGSATNQPYNLKLVLTPLPNRNIEAGEEDLNLSDLEGVKGSATMIMVPVQGYVESYSGSGGGVASTVVGGVQSVVGTGIGLVGTAAGMAFGALGRLMGASPAAQNDRASTTTNTEPQTREQNNSQDRARASNMRIRTLADQRRDQEEEQRKRGTQLYNGMGLNVQPRKDEDDGKEKK